MKTTFDLPEDLLQEAKIAAVKRKTTLKDLVQTGLKMAIQLEPESSSRKAALKRLQKGLHLKGKPLTREQAHERY
jgi:hypothetical protein